MLYNVAHSYNVSCKFYDIALCIVKNEFVGGVFLTAWRQGFPEVSAPGKSRQRTSNPSVSTASVHPHREPWQTFTPPRYIPCSRWLGEGGAVEVSKSERSWFQLISILQVEQVEHGGSRHYHGPIRRLPTVHLFMILD